MKKILFLLFLLVGNHAYAQEPPKMFQNPILSGFNPDPSICRVGDDYYLVTSSFVWYPGIPIYHSKDLVNWELIGHGINRPEQVNFTGLQDKNGIWAVTIRYHEGLFYLITTASECGGNFYITSKNPVGPWSDPIWLKDAPGIDGSLMWDDDGKCYYTGNTWDFKKSWPGQCAIWMQELDLNQQKLVGERKMLTYGHANNASYTESPHLYKINGEYLLLTAEGGTDQYHAIAAHHSKSLWGPYVSDKINPVLSHRQLGSDYPIQAVGHGDIVQTQNGEWWAVVLGKRLVDSQVSLSRETFLCKVKFEEGTPIFNPGYGKVLMEQERPNLPWTSVKRNPIRDDFNGDQLGLNWSFNRIPVTSFHRIENGEMSLNLCPEVADSLVCSAMMLQKINRFSYTASTKMNFKTQKDNEQAGLVIYRNNNSFFMLLKEKSSVVLIKKNNGTKETIARLEYRKPDVFFKVEANRLYAQFSFSESEAQWTPIGEKQNLTVICESVLNKFNGPGIGLYATSNGKKTENKAVFDWFEYKF